jgi:hypothetical protein
MSPHAPNIAELGLQVGDHVCAFHNGGNALDDIVVDYLLKGLQATRRPQFIMCLYNLGLFDGEAVMYALQTHPKIFVNGMIITNPRYTPRQHFLGSP